MKNLAACLLTVFFVFIIFSPALADIAPPPAPHGGDILPGEPATYVRMVAETVLIEALPNSGDEVPTGRVTASFQMHNLGKKDESMTVRFPLNYIGGEVCALSSHYKPVQDFKAWVNDQPAEITIDRDIPGNGYIWEKVDCWANFPVLFPAGKDIHIRVSYTQDAGPSGLDTKAFVSYPYILFTGAGWYGTIGQADITFRAPWNLNKDNLIEWQPTDGGRVVDNEIRWQFKDFEPSNPYGDDPNPSVSGIQVSIVNPAVWSAFVRGRRDTQLNPEDGEAWGRLGKALKEMTLVQRGIYREDYYRESYAAYKKAVELKPWDADWHFGFAELLWGQARFGMLNGTPPTDDFEGDCFKQIKAALKINPDHAKSIQFLIRISNEDCSECISKYGLQSYLDAALPKINATKTQADIYFQTTIASFSTLLTIGPDDNPALLQSTQTPTLPPSGNSTPVPVTVEATLTPPAPAIAQVSTPVLPPTVTVQPTRGPAGGGLCGAVFLPLILIIGFWIGQTK
jgi:hypothetical protein